MGLCETLRKRIQPLRTPLAAYPGLWEVFEPCFMNTAETTVQQSEGDTFIITGDIEAMWLRDSTAQVLHYVRFSDDEEIAGMIEGLIARQAECILRDPYANAFKAEPSDFRPFEDEPRPSDWVWERKYETDSLCYPLWLAERYWKQTGNASFLTSRFHDAMRQIVQVLRVEQRHEQSPYRFQRVHCPPSDTLTRDGRGAPVAYTGMTWSGFRPSDDACRYPYLVPANLFAVRALQAAEKLAMHLQDSELVQETTDLCKEIEQGVMQHGIRQHPEFGPLYAYEVDGLGNANLMDDANVPSLLSLPYLEVCSPDDVVYRNTRSFVLSRENPYFYKGRFAEGIGSPHTPQGYIGPIALCVQAMTSSSTEERAAILNALMRTHAGTGMMHESFDPQAPEKYTRSWFAWANSMFGEMIMRLYEEKKLDAVIMRARAML